MNDITVDQQAHVQALQSENERLSRLVAEKQAYIDEIDRINGNLHNTITGLRHVHDEDIAIIGKVLLDEAEKRDWCDEFDTIIDEVNNRLDHPLPTRTRIYRVHYAYALSYRVSSSAEVRASSEAEARRALEEDPADYCASPGDIVNDLDVDDYYDAQLEVEDVV